MTFFALFIMCLVAAISIACGINFFLRTGPWRAMGYALLAVCVFLLFCASGIWEEAPGQNIGALTLVFAVMLIGGWLCVRFGSGIWRHINRKNKSGD